MKATTNTQTQYAIMMGHSRLPDVTTEVGITFYFYTNGT
jgi:hypothetical protein